MFVDMSVETFFLLLLLFFNKLYYIYSIISTGIYVSASIIKGFYIRDRYEGSY